MLHDLRNLDNQMTIGLLFPDFGRAQTSTNRTVNTFVGWGFFLKKTTSISKFRNIFRSVNAQTLNPHLFSWDGITFPTTSEISINVASATYEVKGSNNIVCETALTTPVELQRGWYLFGYILGATVGHLTSSHFTSLDSVFGLEDTHCFTISLTVASITNGVLSGTTTATAPGAQNTQFCFIDSDGNQHGFLGSATQTLSLNIPIDSPPNSISGYLFKCKQNIKLNYIVMDVHQINSAYKSTTKIQIRRKSDNVLIGESDVLPPTGRFSGSSGNTVSNSFYDFTASNIELEKDVDYGIIPIHASGSDLTAIKSLYITKTTEQMNLLFNNQNFFRVFTNWNNGNPTWKDDDDAYIGLGVMKIFCEPIGGSSGVAFIKLNGVKHKINLGVIKKE